LILSFWGSLPSRIIQSMAEATQLDFDPDGCHPAIHSIQNKRGGHTDTPMRTHDFLHLPPALLASFLHLAHLPSFIQTLAFLGHRTTFSATIILKKSASTRTHPTIYPYLTSLYPLHPSARFNSSLSKNAEDEENNDSQQTMYMCIHIDIYMRVQN